MPLNKRYGISAARGPLHQNSFWASLDGDKEVTYMQAKSLTMRPAGNTKSLQTRENAPKPHLCVNVKLKPNTFLDQKEAIMHNITVPYPEEEEE